MNKTTMAEESLSSKSHQTVPDQQESKTTMNETATMDNDDIFETSSCSGSHQNAPGSSLEGEDDKEMKDRIIKKEEKAVRNARLLVITAIIACAVAVTTAIYIFASKSDETTFELEVSNNRNTYCCSIVLATNDALTQIPTPYFDDTPFSMKATFRILRL
jgi:hypothetical protein